MNSSTWGAVMAANVVALMSAAPVYEPPGHRRLTNLRSRLTPRIIAVAIAVTAAALAWWLTSRPLLIGLDWDNAFHHWQIDGMLTVGGDSCAAGGTLWTCGYTAHMALEPLYGLAALVGRRFDVTTLDSMRAMNAIGITTAAGFLVLALSECGTPAWGIILIAAAWLTSSDVLFLVRTIEDDCLLLGWASVLLFFCLRARTRWSAAPAFASGAVLAAGILTNYSIIVWAPVLFVAAVVVARPDVPMLDQRRAAWGAAIAAGAASVLIAWGGWQKVHDPAHWPWARYAQVLFASPNSDVTGRPATIAAFLRYIALYPLDVVLPRTWYPGAFLAASPARWHIASVLLIVGAIAGSLWPFRRGIRAATEAGHAAGLSSLALLTCAMPAAWIGDTSPYERMDHVPLWLAVLAGAGLSAAATNQPRRRVLRAVVAVAVMLTLAVNVRALERAPRGQSWLARFETLRQQNAPGLTFVFAESEFTPADYDKLESLRIAIPTALIVSPAGAIRNWPFTPVDHVRLDDYRSAPPPWRWLSEPAARLVEP